MLFEDIFEVTAVNPEGKKFDKVTRIVCRSENYEMNLVLDYNSAIYRLPLGSKFHLLLANTLNLDGSADNNEYNQDGLPSLMDSYEYVMHGKIFKVVGATGKDQKMSKASFISTQAFHGISIQSTWEVYVSYGGLLMSLKGEARNLQKMELDQRIYLLIRLA